MLIGTSRTLSSRRVAVTMISSSTTGAVEGSPLWANAGDTAAPVSAARRKLTGLRVLPVQVGCDEPTLVLPTCSGNGAAAALPAHASRDEPAPLLPPCNGNGAAAGRSGGSGTM